MSISSLLHTPLRRDDRCEIEIAERLVSLCRQQSQSETEKTLCTYSKNNLQQILLAFLHRSNLKEQAFLLTCLPSQNELFFHWWSKQHHENSFIINALAEFDYPIPDTLLQNLNCDLLTPKAFCTLVTRLDRDLQAQGMIPLSIKDKALAISKLESFFLRPVIDSMTEDEIAEVIRELVQLKCSSTLLIIAHLPLSRFGAVKKLSAPVTLRKVVNLCTHPHDVMRFLNKISLKKLRLLAQVPINNSNETLNEILKPLLHSTQISTLQICKLRSIPPLLILIAQNLNYPINSLTPFMTRDYKLKHLNQIPFLAIFGQKPAITSLYEYLKSHNHAATLYCLLKSLPPTSSKTLSLEELAPRVNKTIRTLLGELEEQFVCSRRLFVFSTYKYSVDVAKKLLCETLRKIDSLTFDAMIAPFSNSRPLLSHHIFRLFEIHLEAQKIIESTPKPSPEPILP